MECYEADLVARTAREVDLLIVAAIEKLERRIIALEVAALESTFERSPDGSTE